MINNRVDIKDFILKIEQDFPVNNWKIDSIHLWPYLRIKLYSYLVRSIEVKDVKPKFKKRKNLKENLKSIYRSFRSVFSYFKWMKSLPQKETLFVGADAHRIDFNDSRYNRFFDTLIEKHQITQSSLYFEYGLNTKKQYNRDLIFSFSEAFKGYLFIYNFSKKHKIVELDMYADFLDFLKKDDLFNRFTTLYTQKKINRWANLEFYPKVLFFEKALAKIKPKRMPILCYYIDDVFALTSAANRLNIETIEMQHGPQTEIHLSYASWSVLPKEGYDMIPKTFWCWDESSHNVIKDWSKNNPAYSVKVIGNPWIDNWKTKKNNFPEKDYILYSLQPSPLTLEQLFPNSIINFIKTNPQKWFIRLHPRQLNENEKIKSYLENKGVLALVNLEEATQEPLPLLLSNALIHLTHFSGTAIEASLFNLKTVLLNEIGLFSFPDLISTQKAVYLNVNEDEFGKNLSEILVIENNNKNKSFEIQSSTENLFS